MGSGVLYLPLRVVDNNGVLVIRPRHVRLSVITDADGKLRQNADTLFRRRVIGIGEQVLGAVNVTAGVSGLRGSCATGTQWLRDGARNRYAAGEIAGCAQSRRRHGAESRAGKLRWLPKDQVCSTDRRQIIGIEG